MVGRFFLYFNSNYTANADIKVWGISLLLEKILIH